MARKKKYKKVFKGVRYISKALKKYYPSKYKNSKEALTEAGKILKKLKESKQKVVLANILDVKRKKRSGKKTTKKTPPKKSNAPVLTDSMKEAQYYFNTVKYGEDIKNQDPRIKFVSNQIFPKGYSIKGGQTFEEDYFVKFIRFCNNQLAEYKTENDDEEDDAYAQDWLVVCTEPKENKKVKGEWIVQIITTSAYDVSQSIVSGEEVNKVDYGYDPNAEEQDILTHTPSKKVKVDEVDKKTDTKEDKELSKLKIQAELDKVKEKTKQMAIESDERKQIKKSEENIKKAETLKEYAGLLRDKIITKEQFDEVLKLLK